MYCVLNEEVYILIIIVSLVVMSSGCTGMFHPISSNENWRNSILGGGNASGMMQNIAGDSSDVGKTLDIVVVPIIHLY